MVAGTKTVTQKAKKIMNNFKVGDMVRIRKHFSWSGTAGGVRGIVLRELKKSSFGKSIYQVVWQADPPVKTYEPSENLEKYDEE